MSTLDLDYKRDEQLNATVVRASGNIDVFTHIAFRRYLKDIIELNKESRLVIDLASTVYIASSGWAVLLNLAKSLKTSGGKMVLANMKQEIRKVHTDAMHVETLLPCASNPAQLKTILG